MCGKNQLQKIILITRVVLAAQPLSMEHQINPTLGAKDHCVFLRLQAYCYC